ncbi:O-antigen ligase family protein [Pontibacter actiniarum]|nr:O-antigen ligase family protein [Pontibacter actiniarum]
MQAAFSELELKVSLLLLPPILHSLFSQGRAKNRYLFIFVLACFIAAVSSLFMIFYKIYFLDMYRQPNQPLQIDWVYFSFHLPKQINFHAPYFSMYVMLSIFILAHWILKEVNNGQTWKILLGLVTIFFFFTFNVLLSSRTALVSGTIILLIGSIAYFFSKKRYSQAGLVLSLSSILICSLYFNTPYLRRKLEGGTGITQRQQLWRAGFELIKDTPFIGVGPGDTKDRLAVQYSRMGLSSEAKNRLDPHNQYIQMFLALGVMGILVYTVCLLYLLFTSLRNSSYLLTAFVLLYILCGTTESVFNSQKGVVLFAFIAGVLAFREREVQFESSFS